MLAKRQSGQWMSFRCVPVGKLVAHIVEFEQVGLPRAAYGKKLLLRLAESLTGEFGKGFDATKQVLDGHAASFFAFNREAATRWRV
jgi:hypothetical protein